MAIDTSQLATDLGNIISDLPTTGTFAGFTVQGVFTDLDVGKDLESGGFVSDFSAQFYAKLSDFSTVPTAGVTFGASSKVFRVANVSTSPDGIGIRLDLVTPDK